MTTPTKNEDNDKLRNDFRTEKPSKWTIMTTPTKNNDDNDDDDVSKMR